MRCHIAATHVAYSLWVDVLRGLLVVAPDAAPPAAADALRAGVCALCPNCADEVYPFLAQGDLAAALAHAEEVLRSLEGHPQLAGAWEPLRVYLTCVRVLRAHEDPRAGGILDKAYRLLQERAARIDDPELRRSYLENVPYHREIAAEYAKYRQPDGG
jgi:hypothetical protein